jgi:hypothetical protein
MQNAMREVMFPKINTSVTSGGLLTRNSHNRESLFPGFEKLW